MLKVAQVPSAPLEAEATEDLGKCTSAEIEGGRSDVPTMEKGSTGGTPANTANEPRQQLDGQREARTRSETEKCKMTEGNK